MTHENGDIVADSILVLKELIDTDSSDDQTIDYIELLARTLMENNCIEHVFSALSRLDENIPEEKQAVFNALGFYENLTEILTVETCEVVYQKTKFVDWLLKRLLTNEFDDVKHYASELLSILAQNSEDIQLQIGSLDGINTLLYVLSSYRKTDPPSMEEEELVENIINVLCVVVVQPDNRPLFFDAEGLELMRILIKSKKYCRKGALKLTNYVLMNDVKTCIRWLDIGGLGTTFTAFMKRSSKKSKKGFSEDEDDEHIMSMIYSLINSFRDEEYGSYKARVLQKFKENQFEKLERLLELHEKYASKVAHIDNKIALENNEDDDEELKDRAYLDRLEAGLFTLQLVDYVLAYISREDESILKQASKLVNLNNIPWVDVMMNLAEYATHLGDNDDSEEVISEKMYINSLVEFIDANK